MKTADLVSCQVHVPLVLDLFNSSSLGYHVIQFNFQSLGLVGWFKGAQLPS